MRIKLKTLTLQKLVILGILIFITVVFSFSSGRFLTQKNLLNIAKQVSFVIITGAGVTLLMVSRHLDLSVGSTVALSGVISAMLARGGMATGYSFFIGTLIGLLVGVINAMMVVKLKITPLIATLGTMYMGRGITFIITDAKTIREGLPDNFTMLGRENLGPVPVPFIILILIVLIFIILERRTLLGKYSIAVGGNPTAAILSGINAGKVVMLLYVIVGWLAGLSGVMTASRLGVGEPNVGFGFEFDVIIAVLLGGTSLAGGEGSVLGMVIGAFIVAVIGNGLNLMNVLSFYQSVVKGLVLVLAVLLDRKLKEWIKTGKGGLSRK
jgi:ribose/xylose/arabinose/galactoside ABC-type transport system permease subunit